MSGVMEKTLASIPRLLTQSLVGGSNTGSGSAAARQPGQDVTQFIRTVERARTRTQEAAVVSAEMSALRSQLGRPDSGGPAAVRSAFAKALFCQVLGYDTSFLMIHAVNLSQQGRGRDKRLGYLTACLLLHSEHDMATLMLATLQRDLRSSHMGDNCLALLAAPRLVAEIHVTELLPQVIKKLGHTNALVREKAVHCVRALHAFCPSQVYPVLPDLVPLMTSRDPGELTAAVRLCLGLWNSRKDENALAALGPALLHVFKQIQGRAFPASYNYRGVPLPWLQISLIRLLADIAATPPPPANTMSSVDGELCCVLEGLLERAKVGEPVWLALVVESVYSVSKIKIVPVSLITLCSRWVGTLLGSPNNNDGKSSLRYLGLGALASLTKRWPTIAAQHQTVVMHCLSDPDQDIQARTTTLLYAMATPTNAQAVCNHLLKKAQGGEGDGKGHARILTLVSDLAERFLKEPTTYMAMYLNIFGQASKLNSDKLETFTQQVLSRMETLAKSNTNKGGREVNTDSLVQSMLNQVLSEKPPSLAVMSLVVQVIAELSQTLTIDYGQLENQLLPTLSLMLRPDCQRQCLLNHPQAVKFEAVLKSDRVLKFQCTCLQSLMKMLLGGCLNTKLVKDWLDSLDKSDLLKDFATSSYYNELVDLIEHPQDLTRRSEVMFETTSDTIDLSLSFMDSLVMHNLLSGTEVFPSHQKVEVEQPKDSEYLNIDSSMASIPEWEGQPLNNNATSLESSVVSKSSTYSSSRWRDDDSIDDGSDGEQFTLVNVNQRLPPFDETSQLAHDLFSGLENCVLEDSTSFSYWTAEEDIHSNPATNLGFTLHPFGLPSKAKSHRASNNTALDSSINQSLHSSNSNNSSVWPRLNPLWTDASLADGIHKKVDENNLWMEDAERENVSTASIYEQNVAMISTVDSLTDSDPDEECDTSPT